MTISEKDLAVLLRKLLKEDPPPKPLPLKAITAWAFSICEDPSAAYTASPKLNHRSRGPVLLADLWSDYREPCEWEQSIFWPLPKSHFLRVSEKPFSTDEIQAKAQHIFEMQAVFPKEKPKADRKCQRDKVAVQAIAKELWAKYPILDAPQVELHPGIQRILHVGKPYKDTKTLPGWLREVAPPNRAKRGRRSDATIKEQLRICALLDIPWKP